MSNGGATADVEVLWDDLLAGPRMPAAVRDRLSRGDALPGFGPQAYPAGDPRAVRLLQLARRAGPLPPIAAEVTRRTGWSPSVDFGFVALRRSLGAPRGAALTLQFGSRCVGLLAHVLEQRRSGQRFAPRAVYTGG